MAPFNEDVRFVVHIDAKSDIPSQDFQGRDALGPVFDNLNQYVATTHFKGQNTAYWVALQRLVSAIASCTITWK